MRPFRCGFLFMTVVFIAMPGPVPGGGFFSGNDEPGILSAEFIFVDPPFGQCHASTIVETPGRGGVW